VSYSAPTIRRHWHSINTITSGPLCPQLTFNNNPTWVGTSIAVYVPILVPVPVVVKKLWFAFYSGTGTYDLGLYNAAGVALLTRGSTSVPGGANDETWDCTDTAIQSGIYYMALVMSSSPVATLSAAPAAPIPAAMGCYTEAGALPLPATATFSVAQTLALIPAMGIFCDTKVS
jgi:hypothetical protein